MLMAVYYYQYLDTKEILYILMQTQLTSNMIVIAITLLTSNSIVIVITRSTKLRLGIE